MIRRIVPIPRAILPEISRILELVAHQRGVGDAIANRRLPRSRRGGHVGAAFAGPGAGPVVVVTDGALAHGDVYRSLVPGGVRPRARGAAPSRWHEAVGGVRAGGAPVGRGVGDRALGGRRGVAPRGLVPGGAAHAVFQHVERGIAGDFRRGWIYDRLLRAIPDDDDPGHPIGGPGVSPVHTALAAAAIVSAPRALAATVVVSVAAAGSPPCIDDRGTCNWDGTTWSTVPA
eukprot:765594-Hanusia_phi.AAC.7